MSAIRFRLFGKFNASYADQALNGFEAIKIQELLCYLLLHRDRTHARETLADLLWGESVAEKSKKHMRQTLWNLQTALAAQGELSRDGFLLVEHDSVRLNSQNEVWLDVAVFEHAFARMRSCTEKPITEECALLLEEAVALYTGDLLEGWYQDWCFYERERLQNMFLTMLDKLMGYCEKHLKYEQGIDYGALILRYDRAREHTHRQLMLLQYLAGNRTGALRQYERCAAALKEELDVKPDRRTVALYEQVRAGHVGNPTPAPARSHAAAATDASLPHVLERLDDLQITLAHIQQQIQREIKSIKVAILNRN